MKSRIYTQTIAVMQNDAVDEENENWIFDGDDIIFILKIKKLMRRMRY